MTYILIGQHAKRHICEGKIEVVRLAMMKLNPFKKEQPISLVSYTSK